MSEYYEFRKKLHNIYQNDTKYGDLTGSILEYREKNRNVTTVSIQLSDYKIYVTLEQNTPSIDYDKIVFDICAIIRSYLENAIDNTYSKEEANSIVVLLHTRPFLDAAYLGNTIELSL